MLPLFRENEVGEQPEAYLRGGEGNTGSRIKPVHFRKLGRIAVSDVLTVQIVGPDFEICRRGTGDDCCCTCNIEP